MRRFAPVFAVLAVTEFLDHVHGGKPIVLANILSSCLDMSALWPVRTRRQLSGHGSSSVASSTSQPPVEAEASSHKGKAKEEMQAFRVFQPFFARELPEWSKPRDVTLALGNYRVDVDAKVLDSAGDGDMDVCPAPDVPLESGSLVLPVGSRCRPTPRPFSCR